MSLDAFEKKATQGEIIDHHVSMVGTGASAPTKENGPGVTVTRTGAGAYTLTWSDPQGTFVGCTYGFRATTLANMAGHTLSTGVYTASAKTLTLLVSDAADAADDLEALEHLDLIVSFKRTNA